MTHFTFIAASYGAGFLGLGLLTFWLVADYLGQRRALAELEARGLGRKGRAARSAGEAA